MSTTTIEAIRRNNEEIELLEKTLVLIYNRSLDKHSPILDQMKKSICIKISEISDLLLKLIEDDSYSKKSEIDIMSGITNYNNNKLNPESSLLLNYYEMLKEFKILNKTSIEENTQFITEEMLFQYYYSQAIAELSFTEKEQNGKSLDLSQAYEFYKTFENSFFENKTYLFFLKNFWDFDIPIEIKKTPKYKDYLTLINNHLLNYYYKCNPLRDIKDLFISVNNQLVDFKEKIKHENYSSISINNLKLLAIFWIDTIKKEKERLKENINLSEIHFCQSCDKIFSTESGYSQHNAGKQHKKKLKENGDNLLSFKSESLLIRVKQHNEEIVEKNLIIFESILSLEFSISLFVDYFKNNIEVAENNEKLKESSINYNPKELTQDILDEIQFKLKKDNSLIHNPKNIPIGWDGNPIPYWIFKLQGLEQKYSCEICGNFEYIGRKAFEKHFQEWRHSSGMESLGIPNTIHFKNLITIDEVNKCKLFISYYIKYINR